jgi:uncharacterized membrane protein
MNLAHVHLLLNHFPTVGMIIGLGLFAVGLLSKSNDLKRASLVIFLGLALLTIPTYMSGNAAQDAICMGDPKAPCSDAAVSKAAIQTHEGAALVAFAVMQLVGAFSWLGLWQYRRASRMPAVTLSIILLLSLATLALMTRAALIGGEIRHPEVRADSQPATAGEPLGRELGAWVQSVPWVWPTCETLHFVGLCLLFGIAATVDLRVLGMMRGIPFEALHRLLPWGILGFGINLITGMLFFVAEPGQYLAGDFFHRTGAFQWKMAMIVLAGINVIYFTIFDEVWVLGAGDDAPLTAKTVAASALVLVLGVLFCGRMLPFLGSTF